MRTTYEADVTRLKEAGATHVFAAEVAVATVITDRVLRNHDNLSKPQTGRSAASADDNGIRGTE